jgi:ubiquinol-cytochrome c reductase cytochrome b subunit
VVLHIVALRVHGSTNPDGVDIKAHVDGDGRPLDGMPFHPYMVVKDILGVVVFLLVFCAVLFFAPSFFGMVLEPDNFMPANHLVTPQHIAPIWYLTPFYSVLRAVPDKLAGVSLMAASVAILFVLPWLDRSPVRSIRYKGYLSKIALTLFTISFIVLGYLGMQPPTPALVWAARLCTAIYFAFFLLMPWYTRFESTKQPPLRIPPG